jgi:hypothetical protein
MPILSLLLAVTTHVTAPCKPAAGDADAILHRAADVIGMTRLGTRVVRIDATDIVSLNYESDRSYPPYLLQADAFTEYFDAGTGAIRHVAGTSMAGASQGGGVTTLNSRLASYVVGDTLLTPSGELHAQTMTTRPLNAWAVIADWIAAHDARVAETCALRDYPRLVLTRAAAGPHGGERLYIDQRSGYPIALERREGNYLWGQTTIQYLYGTWTRVGDAHFPGTATRMVDGENEITRTFGSYRIVARDSAPSLALPALTAPMSATIAGFLAPTNPDTVRVSPTTVILRNRGYAEVVTLARDTVFVFDATQGEIRAREDSVWIGKLFPGTHPIAVVVTDLAYPHIAGVRYWVANGATIISHRAARGFLERVVARRWSDSLDLLEQRRAKGNAAPRLKFRAVDDSLQLAGGAITLFAFDGPSSEVALGAYVRGDNFLWASDFVQSAARPTQYLDEVAAAVRRMGFTPAKLAAEHLPLIDWSRVAPLAARSTP